MSRSARALAERRHLDRDAVEAEVEILAEGAFGDHRAKIAVRRRDEAHVDLARLRGVDANDLAALEHAEELRLGRRAAARRPRRRGRCRRRRPRTDPACRPRRRARARAGSRRAPQPRRGRTAPLARREARWMRSATTSLPTPVSPVTRTWMFPAATSFTRRSSRCIGVSFARAPGGAIGRVRDRGGQLASGAASDAAPRRSDAAATRRRPG